MMNRRDALKRTALITGYALSAPVVAAVLQGCQADGPTTPDWEPAFLTKEQGDLVVKVSDLFLPKTETPGALDVGVPDYIDKSIQLFMEPEEQKHLQAGIESIDKKAQDMFGSAFAKCTSEQQYELLNQLDEDAKVEAERLQQLPPPNPDEKRFQHFFPSLKALMLSGYFTSELVGTEVLAYDPIPGEYIPCMPLDDAGATWSL
ncbi:MAG: gluconate 2-dehydrogenase subunit 3 family protein [Saprospiraceae bacterium]|nr:gluconate 2-dehydrogenase subunit 3 family protein [Saprospiraceae bacterium]